MRRFVVSAFVLVLLAAPGARADFVVAPGQTVHPPAATATGVGAGSPGATPAPDPALPPQPRFKVAQGFGDRVPLSFAVRQIVPRAVRVSYGPGTNPDALVDWKGGQGWNWVLYRAVHPLGLRLVLGRMTVEIRK